MLDESHYITIYYIVARKVIIVVEQGCRRIISLKKITILYGL